MIGTIHKAGSMFLRQAVADCEDSNGDKYELTLVGAKEPLVLSRTTGKYFHLTWEEIMSLAVEAGINNKA